VLSVRWGGRSFILFFILSQLRDISFGLDTVECVDQL